MNSAIVYYCFCRSFYRHRFVCPALLRDGLIRSQQTGNRIHSLRWLEFPAINHRVPVSFISPSQHLCFYSFFYICNSGTEGRPAFFPMFSLLQSENYVSLCFLVMVVQVGILQNTLAQERKKKKLKAACYIEISLPINQKLTQSYTSGSHCFLYLWSELSGVLWFRHFIFL